MIFDHKQRLQHWEPTWPQWRPGKPIGTTYDETISLSADTSQSPLGHLTMSILMTLASNSEINLSGQLIAQAVADLLADGQLQNQGFFIGDASVTLSAAVMEAMIGGLLVEEMISLMATASQEQVGNLIISVQAALDADVEQASSGVGSLIGSATLQALIENPTMGNLVINGLVGLSAQAIQSQVGTAVQSAITSLEANVLIALTDFLGQIEVTLSLAAAAQIDVSAQATMQAITNLIADIVQASAGTLNIQSGISLSSETTAAFLDSLGAILASLSLDANAELTVQAQVDAVGILTLAAHAAIIAQGAAIKEALVSLGVNAAIAQIGSLAITEAITLQLAATFETLSTSVSGAIGVILRRVGETLKISAQEGTLKTGSRSGGKLKSPSQDHENLES